LAGSVRGRLWVHSLESGESRDLAPAGNQVPFWSPDSRFIGYVSQGKLRKIEATGGSRQIVADLSGGWGGGAWNQDDVIVFGGPGLFRVPASGGVPVPITALDPARHEMAHYSPSFLPDGRHFVYARMSSDSEKEGIYLASVDARPEQRSSKPLVASHSQPAYAPSRDPSTGYLLFLREGTLMAQPFDNRRLELKGQAAPVAEQVSSLTRGGFVHFSVSTTGMLVFERDLLVQQFMWLDREGKIMGTVGDPGEYTGAPEVSPDGTRAAVTKTRAEGGHLIFGCWISLATGRAPDLRLGRRSTLIRSGRRMGAGLSLAPTGTASSTCIRSRRAARKPRRLSSDPKRTSTRRVGRATDDSCCTTCETRNRRPIFGCSPWMATGSRFRS
jgi:hypothetical protein